MSQDGLRQQVTTKLVDLLESGVIPWRKPWTSDPNAAGGPASVVSKKPYKGINTLLLTATALQRGYSCKWWATAKQWEKLGGTIKTKPDGINTDDWATKILFYLPFNRVNKAGKEGRSFFLKTYELYNLEQVEGEKLNKYRILPPQEIIEALPDYIEAQRVIAATAADIRYGGNEARYILPEPYANWPNHTAGDYIEMPHQRQYVNIDSFYETQFHELAHWSELRVGWSRSKPENTYGYAELIAEISSCFLANELRLPLSEDLKNHKDYLGHWLGVMKKDSNFIFKAASQAHKVVDYILSFSREKVV